MPNLLREGQQPMSQVTEDVIARIATRIFNEVPGGATLPSDHVALSETIGNDLDPGVAAGAAEAAGHEIPTSALTTALPDQSLSLDRIADALQSAATAAAHPETIAEKGTQGAYFTPPISLAEATPLSAHADNLVRQQTLNGNAGSSFAGLKDFVARVQTCQHRLTSTLDSPDQVADPFAALLRASLPATSKLGKTDIFDVAAIRRDFPVLNQKVHGKQLVWFDNAATTQKPQSVIDALSHFYSHDNSNIHRGAHALAARATDAYEQARDKVRDHLHAGSSDEIVFVRGTTEGVNLVAQTYGRKFLQEGDEIVLSVLEHHANIVPWQLIAKERGAVIRVAPVDDDGNVLLDAYEKLLGPRTKLVGLAHANNSLGAVLPVAEMTALAKRYGARVLIDGAQSVAHIPVDVQRLGVDFYVFSGHKIIGPTGIGAVYIARELHDVLPPWQGSGNMIANVTFEETTYNKAPAKFEAGTPNIADAVGLGAALDYVNRVGIDAIAAYEHKLLAYATEQLSRIDGLRIIGNPKEKVSVLSFVLRDKPVPEVGKYLDQQGIAVRAGHHCAQPSLRRFGLEATVRPSFAFYNTFEEVDRLTTALKNIR
jgi:cysteine desulfurase / selenocysteine lyase